MSWAMDFIKRKSRPKLVPFLWLLITLLFVRATGMPTEEMLVPVSVNRRQNGHDIVTFSNSTQHINCDADTYLVDEQRCVDNQVLLNACRFAFFPHQGPSNHTFILYINDQSSIVVVKHQPLCCSQPVLVNNTMCNISSLEVYRGREQTIEISYEGFSLAENGMFKINQSSLPYPIVEFVRELYRMKLSCFGGGLPESGCLFFKVGGETNLTKAKFGDRVPGTVQTPENYLTTTMLSVVQPTTDQQAFTDQETFTDHEIFSDQNSSVSNTLLTTTLSSSGTSGPTTDLIVYIIIAATGVVTLLFVVVLLCMILIYCIKTSKPNNTTTTTDNKKDQSGVRQLEQSLTNEASAPPLTNLWCEQSDMMSEIHHACQDIDGDNHTYLVDERRCVSNQDLIDGCTFVIAPSGSHLPHSIFVNLNITESKINLLTVNSYSHKATAAMITFRDPRLQETNSLYDCHVDSLGVYRRKKRIIEISHDGFGIINEGTMEIDISSLMYDTEELKGELYQMNLSCSGESGCLFFKVGGETNITNAKFDSSVPGTIVGRHTTTEKTTQNTLDHAMSTDAPG